MARNKKDKIFDLFKSDFKITFFYKPSMEIGDDFYIIVLNDIIELKIKLINDVIVIDSVLSLSKSYIKPIYDNIIDIIMNQSKLTVLLSLFGGNTFEIRQACINHNAPIIEDERYITVPKKLYDKWKNQNNSIEKYGFYLLSVSDEEPMTKPTKDIKVVDVQSNTKHDEEHVILSDLPIDKIKSIFRHDFEDIVIEDINDNSFRGFITPNDTFVIEIVNDTVYIKEPLSSIESTLNLIKVMDLVNSFEKITDFFSNVFIVSIMHKEIYRICMTKGYQQINESNKLPVNNLFKQAFHGYGTFKITN